MLREAFPRKYRLMIIRDGVRPRINDVVSLELRVASDDTLFDTFPGVKLSIACQIKVRIVVSQPLLLLPTLDSFVRAGVATEWIDQSTRHSRRRASFKR